MLHSLYIESLFDIYTYDIDLTDTDGKGLKFITSPNGYGKTTILNIIHALYSKNWSYFLQLSFRNIRFTFDESILQIIQHKESLQEEKSDEIEQRTCMEFIMTDLEGRPIEEYDHANKEDNNDPDTPLGNPLRLYSGIQPCYFIHDNRLYKQNISKLADNTPEKQTAVIANAEDLKNKLANAKSRIADMVTNLTFDKPISQEEYQAAYKELKPFIDNLVKYGLIKTGILAEYQENNAVYLRAIIQVIQQIKTDFEPFIQKLQLFENIIARSEFSYKHINIHINYGYRFVAENKEHTILSLSTLSSGEQHILIMMYEMLFTAPEESLVLLDEPELSFHFLWQSNFLSYLRDIQQLRPRLQWVICTHSPQIFGRKWELSTDLYQLQTQQQTNQE